MTEAATASQGSKPQIAQISQMTEATEFGGDRRRIRPEKSIKMPAPHVPSSS